MKTFRDMTPDEQLAWGRVESLARQADLTATSADALVLAQANAERRRNLIRASRSEASNAVIRANRAILAKFGGTP